MGERVATIAWNGYRHLELYFAVSGAGSVLHTINPRLHPEQIAWIVNHAEDSALFFDLTFLPLVEAIAPHCPTVRHWVMMTDRAHMPASPGIAGLLCYEELVGSGSDKFAGPSSTRTPRRRCATRRAPPAIRRACSTATARRCCTRWRRRCRTPSTCRRATSSCRSCRCSM
jgi:acyl-CoA synthetase (AMP-forming)/AMP-acid ligase II